ncbi:ABC-three component system protein [Bradyrhizobium sp. USDA 3650]
MPVGNKGDLSCDGYLKSPPTVFACYGPENGGSSRQPSDIVSKATSDYSGAVDKWPAIKEWTFVSNYMGVVPAPVTSALEDLSADGKVVVRYFGWNRFEHHLLEMDAEVVEDLIGEIPVTEDYIRLQPAAVRQVVNSVAAAFSLKYLGEMTKPVPVSKLEINEIPACHAAAIKNGLLARDVVESCVLEDADASLATRLSVAFKDKYKELRAQGFDPGQIVDKLADFALAGRLGSTEEMTASWAVIAYLFEKCSIFEDKVSRGAS